MARVLVRERDADREEEGGSCADGGRDAAPSRGAAGPQGLREERSGCLSGVSEGSTAWLTP